jgi:hypothetical protein
MREEGTRRGERKWREVQRVALQVEERWWQKIEREGVVR